MLFQRFFCEPLAQAGYVIADGDEAVVVDPRRDVDDVLAFVREQRLRVRLVVATHVHADFVAGLHEVAAATGAPIAVGERSAGRFACRRLHDGETLRLGDATVDVLTTPGHTLDSVSLHVQHAAAPGRLLTGDTLFVGDVGRPDLSAAQGQSSAAMAATLFASLQRFASLAPATEVWPAHGAGSACGSNIATASSSTLDAERADNWALREGDGERFVARLLAATSAPPAHFARVAATNLGTPPLLATLAAAPRWSAAQFTAALAGGTVAVDVRSWTAYGRGHWPGAINIGLDGGEFEPWAGALLPANARLALHADDEAQARAAQRRLQRVGLDDVAGFCLDAPPEPAVTPQLEAVDLFAPAGETPWQVVDVRRAEEFAVGHVAGARHCPLHAGLAAVLPADLHRAQPTAVVCDGGYRSSAALALLRAAGFTALHNVRDGMRGWRANHLPLATGGPAAGAATSRQPRA